MRVLNYRTEYKKMLTPEVVSYIAKIHEMKGRQDLSIEAHKDVLSELLEIAMIQSTEASNRIEGIITTDDMLLIRYIPIFSEKVKALERRKRIESMPVPLRLCC